MEEGVRPLVPADGAARPPPDLKDVFYPTFQFVGLRCDDFALSQPDLYISTDLPEEKKIGVIYHEDKMNIFSQTPFELHKQTDGRTNTERLQVVFMTYCH